MNHLDPLLKPRSIAVVGASQREMTGIYRYEQFVARGF